MAAGDITQKLQGIGGYRLAALLGFNGMFATFQGEEPHTGASVLIVVVHQSYINDRAAWETFSQEFNALLETQSDYICGPISLGTEAAHYYAVYKWEQGGHLGVYVRDSGLPDVSLSYQWLGQIARGLAAMGRKGIVHRIISPASIFILSSGSAKLLHAAWGQMVLASEGGLLNPAWSSVLPFVAPEIAAGQEGDESSDVYTLGANLYFLLTGQPPFWHEDPQTLAYMIQHDQPDMGGIEALVGPEAFDVLSEMLAKDPADRPVNLPALGDRLISVGQNIVAGGFGASPEEELPEPDNVQKTPPTAGANTKFDQMESHVVPKFVTQGQDKQADERQLPPKHRERVAPLDAGRGYRFEEAGAQEPAPPSPQGDYPQASEPAQEQQAEYNQSQYQEKPYAPGTYEEPKPSPHMPALPPQTPAVAGPPGPRGAGKMNKKLLVIVSAAGVLLIVGSIIAALVVASLLRGGSIPVQEVAVTKPEAAPPPLPKVSQQQLVQQYEENRRRLRALAQWVKGYYRANGIWPRQLGELESLGATKSEFVDIWETPMEIRETFVVSAGADKKWDTDDDAWWDAEKDVAGGFMPRHAPAPALQTPAPPVE